MTKDTNNEESSLDSYYENKINELKASISRLKKKQKNELVNNRKCPPKIQ